MQKIYILFFSLFVAASFSACDLKNKEAEPIAVFTKIYDNADFEKAFYPTDIKQAGDSGFIILGHTPTTTSSFHSVYLMKIDQKGKFQWESSSDALVNPSSELIQVGNDYKFICMGSANKNPYLAVASKGLGTSQNIGADISYPLAACGLQGGGYLVESYSKDDASTQLSKFDANGSKLFTNSYQTFEGDVEEKIFRYVIYQGPSTPFFVGEGAGGTYFFNGYNNFTFSLISVDGSGKQNSTLTGERYEGAAMTNAVLLSNGKYATSNFIATGENIFSLNTSLNEGTVVKINGNLLPEINKNARVVIHKAVINSKNVVIYGTDTKNGQIALFAYDESNGNLLGVKYLGATNRFEMGGFAVTKDGGLIVAGRTFVAGRFSRICVFKLSADDANTLVAGTGK